jgi:hypothetical protein
MPLADKGLSVLHGLLLGTPEGDPRRPGILAAYEKMKEVKEAPE